MSSNEFVTRSGDTVIFSMPVTVMGRELKNLKLADNDSLTLTFRMELDVNRLAELIQKEGSDKSDPSWAKRLATFLATEGLKDVMAGSNETPGFHA
jgi:hypothetical protein